MTLKTLPRGAKLTTAWCEVSSYAYPKGWFNEVTICHYEADMTYADGMVIPAAMVAVYDDGKCVYKQAFYGETAETDAERHGNDAVSKALYANA